MCRTQLTSCRDWLRSTGDKQSKKLANKADATRADLVAAAQKNYAAASAASGTKYASLTSSLAQATGSAKTNAFNTWSDSELKAYLDSYGVPIPQGTTTNQLRAYARNHANWFHYGTTTPQGTLWEKAKEYFNWAYGLVAGHAHQGAECAQHEATKGAHRAQEAGTHAKDRAYEEKEKAKHLSREEL